MMEKEWHNSFCCFLNLSGIPSLKSKLTFCNTDLEEPVSLTFSPQSLDMIGFSRIKPITWAWPMKICLPLAHCECFKAGPRPQSLSMRSALFLESMGKRCSFSWVPKPQNVSLGLLLVIFTNVWGSLPTQKKAEAGRGGERYRVRDPCPSQSHENSCVDSLF